MVKCESNFEQVDADEEWGHEKLVFIIDRRNII